MKRLVILFAVAVALILHVSCAQKPTASAPQPQREARAAILDQPLMMAVAEGSQNDGNEPAPAAAAAPAEPAPQERVALPPGHPDISQMQAPKPPAAAAAPAGALPPGHPDISQMGQQKPAAPAPAAATPAPQAAAKAHQEADGCCPVEGHEAAGQVAQNMPLVPGGGTLTIHVRQGSGNAPPISGGTIHLELHQQDKVLHTADVELDINGHAVVEDLPVYMQFQPVLKMMHAEVEYQHIGRTMGPAVPSQQVEMIVYESTEQKPDWQVRMRHVMASPVGEWLQVSEIIAFENPMDRAWLGRDIGEGRRASFEIPLPKSARDIQVLSGFHACCVRLEEDRLVSLAALLPGQSQYQIAYLIPIEQGAAELTVAAPVATRQLAIFLPDDASEVTPQGLDAMGTTTMGEGNSIRMFRAGGVAADQQVGLTISGLTTVVAAAAGAASASTAKIVAGIGGLVIILFGGVFLFARSGKPKHA
jgi:hypothetical protein